LFENSRKVSRAAQNARTGRMFETLLQGLISDLCGTTKNAFSVKQSMFHYCYAGL